MNISNIRFFLGIFFVFSSVASYAYQANCSTNDGRNFNISVENKVLTVDNKYRHYYQGKTWTGWYKYANSKYIYKTGSFNDGEFPIEVVNSRGQTSSGQCYFR